jgi:hypothetical protein
MEEEEFKMDRILKQKHAKPELSKKKFSKV